MPRDSRPPVVTQDSWSQHANRLEQIRLGLAALRSERPWQASAAANGGERGFADHHGRGALTSSQMYDSWDLGSTCKTDAGHGARHADTDACQYMGESWSESPEAAFSEHSQVPAGLMRNGQDDSAWSQRLARLEALQHNVAKMFDDKPKPGHTTAWAEPQCGVQAVSKGPERPGIPQSRAHSSLSIVDTVLGDKMRREVTSVVTVEVGPSIGDASLVPQSRSVTELTSTHAQSSCHYGCASGPSDDVLVRGTHTAVASCGSGSAAPNLASHYPKPPPAATMVGVRIPAASLGNVAEGMQSTSNKHEEANIEARPIGLCLGENSSSSFVRSEDDYTRCMGTSAPDGAPEPELEATPEDYHTQFMHFAGSSISEAELGAMAGSSVDEPPAVFMSMLDKLRALRAEAHTPRPVPTPPSTEPPTARGMPRRSPMLRPQSAGRYPPRSGSTSGSRGNSGNAAPSPGGRNDFHPRSLLRPSARPQSRPSSARTSRPPAIPSDSITARSSPTSSVIATPPPEDELGPQASSTCSTIEDITTDDSIHGFLRRAGLEELLPVLNQSISPSGLSGGIDTLLAASESDLRRWLKSHRSRLQRLLRALAVERGRRNCCWDVEREDLQGSRRVLQRSTSVERHASASQSAASHELPRPSRDQRTGPSTVGGPTTPSSRRTAAAGSTSQRSTHGAMEARTNSNTSCITSVAAHVAASVTARSAEIRAALSAEEGLRAQAQSQADARDTEGYFISSWEMSVSQTAGESTIIIDETVDASGFCPASGSTASPWQASHQQQGPPTLSFLASSREDSSGAGLVDATGRNSSLFSSHVPLRSPSWVTNTPMSTGHTDFSPDMTSRSHIVGGHPNPEEAWSDDALSPEDENDAELVEALRRSRQDQGLPDQVPATPSTPHTSFSLNFARTPSTGSFVDHQTHHTAQPRTRQARIRELLHHLEALCPVDAVRVENRQRQAVERHLRHRSPSPGGHAGSSARSPASAFRRSRSLMELVSERGEPASAAERALLRSGAGPVPSHLLDGLVERLPQSRAPDCGTELCTICLQAPESGESLTTLPCCHWYHRDCIREWLTHSRLCPLCKASAVPENIEVPSCS